MRNPVAHHSFASEFAIVTLVSFGYFSYASVETVLAVFRSGSLDPVIGSTGVSSQGLFWLIKFELISFTVVLVYLWLRGWRYEHFRVEPSMRSTAAGVGLYFAAMMGFYTMYLLLYPMILPYYGDDAGEMFMVTASLVPIVLLSIINPIFEEVLVLGYVVRALEGRTSVVTAVNISVGVRLLYHLYQGPIAVAMIIPVGVLFGWYYVKHGRLWSVIVAHALLDLAAPT